jgi:hypothetical protein
LSRRTVYTGDCAWRKDRNISEPVKRTTQEHKQEVTTSAAQSTWKDFISEEF